ncbi:MAG: response regulator, partial [Cellulosilyticaceae bacterium]
MFKKEEVKILLVDADFVWMEEIKVALEEDGFSKIKACVDGKTAMREIADFEPNIMIVEQMTTHKDGLTIIQHVRGCGIEIEVILTTRHISDVLMHKASGLNIQYVIVKPAL